MERATDIETPRLRLRPIPLEALTRLLDGDVEGASLIQGSDFSDHFLASVNERFLTIHLDGLRRHPSDPGWFVRAVTRTHDGIIVGHCGFHGTPQDIGRAEIGYTIFPPFRRCGYGAESAQGLVDWARTRGMPAIVASVSVTNVASIGLVTKLGFRASRVVATPSGEEEFVFELPL
ncbi:MAG: GNAT family N-acetyltransferase [Acidobacteriota bacterium]|nr:GNAT family N-acetyltransferase [Acidobacteriota bacterium]